MTDPGQRLADTTLLQLRLPAAVVEKIEWLARRDGVSVANLLQGWVLQRVHREFGGSGAAGGP